MIPKGAELWTNRSIQWQVLWRFKLSTPNWWILSGADPKVLPIGTLIPPPHFLTTQQEQQLRTFLSPQRRQQFLPSFPSILRGTSPPSRSPNPSLLLPLSALSQGKGSSCPTLARPQAARLHPPLEFTSGHFTVYFLLHLSRLVFFPHAFHFFFFYLSTFSY